MSLLNLARVTMAGLRRHTLRTLLSVLGVSIGIAAVIATAAIGGGSAARIQQQMDALGEDFLWIHAGSRNLGGVRTGFGGTTTLTRDDSAAIVANVPEIARCSPRVTGRAQIVARDQNWNTTYTGVNADFFDIRRRHAADGAVFAPADVTQRSRVMVLGADVAARLFDGVEPVGRSVRMGNFVFQVIGVLDAKGSGRGGLDRDDAVFLPISTEQETINGRRWVDDIMCSATSPGLMGQAEAAVTDLLRDRHRLRRDAANDFLLQQPVEFLQMRAQSASTMRMLLLGIGAISLVVGGIGIMNIMLVSVTERRREIGVRMAVGARMRDIRWQFLVEAASIGLAGGVLGIGLGAAAEQTAGLLFGLPVVVSPQLLVVVTMVAVGTGMIFGYLPAHRASALDPIEAIHADA